ncbi:ATP-binding protein [Streptomyces clavuligerus]|uniref:Regulatory protein n=1 Tax=Streptomyces clavuligerus TaxID=1901 RepID=E2PYB9_STRCL|nr:ATP-binding protein [Streptomyces clavuligerus]ANW17238.1 ATPase [Streptomyces clavuligerus]AXU11778.1 ATP-binding protein [Streptomyces clavuligerus]EFG10295.1 Regulatory protein [Streptomyces clavuligerus]MBY6301616.1 ATP-binding protein [Streptomyces clavuligerus]QCS04558.1 ATP-binding protein [Streptomyces clavuligerus]
MESRGSVPVRPLSYDGVWRFTVPTIEVSVPRARAAVRGVLRGEGLPLQEDIEAGVLLIVSELVTNAVRHAAVVSPEATVEVAVRGGWIRISVEDRHPYRPRAVETDGGQTGGRGLLLVREITLEAGGRCDVERTANGGKAVWAELPLKLA